MSQLTLFKMHDATDFHTKLNAAIGLIKRNKSIVAMRVLEVLQSGQITVGSFYDLSKKHYSAMQADMKKNSSVILPDEFPPTASAVRQIESELDGVIYEDKHIYLSPRKNIWQIAKTLVHEVGHFLNARIFDEECEMKDYKLARYSDEVRSFTAVTLFEKNGSCLRRSDIKKVHEKVTSLYPEFVDPKIKTSTLGYIYGSYDKPLDEYRPVTPG